MAKNHVQKGDTVSLTAPTGGVVSGMLYIIGAMAVVASFSAPAGALFEGHLTDVWDLPKASADTIAEGVAIYWDNTNSVVTTTATANYLIGTATEARASGDTSAYVRLDGRAVAVTAAP